MKIAISAFAMQKMQSCLFFVFVAFYNRFYCCCYSVRIELELVRPLSKWRVTLRFFNLIL